MPGPLLVTWQPGQPSLATLVDDALAGVAEAAPDLGVLARPAPAATVDDVEAASGAVLLTTEHFGAVAGLVKDLLERIYPWFEEVPHRNPGLPYLLVAKGGTDGTGAVRDVTRILTGLRWRAVLPPVVVTGSVTDDHRAAVREQAATLAIGVDTGVF